MLLEQACCPDASHSARIPIEPDEAVRRTIWSSGEIRPLQLFRIGAWKSAQGLAWLSLNTETEIREASTEAVAALAPLRESDVLHGDVDWKTWGQAADTAMGSKREQRGLRSLDGIGLPMASAIAAYLLPQAFPVIDKWTVRAIFGDETGNHWKQTIRTYEMFTKHLCEVATAYFPTCDTVHQVDQAVMNAIIGCKEPRGDCKHVLFKAFELPE